MKIQAGRRPSTDEIILTLKTGDCLWLTRAEAERLAGDIFDLLAPDSSVEQSASPDLLALFQLAARDESLNDRDVRNVVKYLSAEPITEADKQRTQELAARYGWKTEARAPRREPQP